MSKNVDEQLINFPELISGPPPDSSMAKIKVRRLRKLINKFMDDVESLFNLPFMEAAEEKIETSITSFEEGIDLRSELQRLEINLIKTALDYTNWRQVKAARLLGMNPTTLNSKIKKYGIGE